MVRILSLFIGSVIVWSSVAYAQDCPVEANSFKVWPEDPNNPLTNRFRTHREAEKHYDSCSLFSYQLWLEYGRVVGLLNTCLDSNPNFGECGSFVDGPNGAVYKPESETTGKIVFLLPASYCDGKTSLISNVKILSKATGQEVATSQLRHCGVANQGRLHWNINATAEQLAQHGAILVVYSFNGGQECREIPNPLVRYD